MEDLDRALGRAIKAADNEDGAPVSALRNIAHDVDYLIVYGVTAAEFRQHKKLYEGTKRAGL